MEQQPGLEPEPAGMEVSALCELASQYRLLHEGAVDGRMTVFLLELALGLLALLIEVTPLHTGVPYVTQGPRFSILSHPWPFGLSSLHKLWYCISLFFSFLPFFLHFFFF